MTKSILFITVIFLLSLFQLKAQTSSYNSFYKIKDIDVQSFEIKLPDSFAGEFVSFSFKIEHIKNPESLQIRFFQITKDGKDEIKSVTLNDESYQEETKNKETTFLSPLFFITPDVKVLKIEITSKSYQRNKKTLLHTRIFDPFYSKFQGNIDRDTTASCTKPPLRTRTQWACPDGDTCLHGPIVYTTVTHLIVHHSASANTSSNWDAVVLSFWDMHVNTNGWNDIGYNYLVAPNGIVYEGRAGGDNVLGAHFSAMNTGTMGVCIIGTYSTVLPSSIAMKNTARILGWKAQQIGINPFDSAQHTAGFIPRIAGHRSSGTTECPGDSLYAHLPQLRQQVKDCMDGVLNVMENQLLFVKIYPNPTHSKLTIESNNKSELIIYNTLGIICLKMILDEYKNEIPLENLSKGIYLLEFKNENNRFVQKLIVE